MTMAKEYSMDRLTSQLYHLPAIIGRMGISIANAQKALNTDYVDSVTKLMGMIQHTLGQAGEEPESQARVAAMRSLLESLAPSRYQFTETTIDFSADLAETMDEAKAVGLGLGTQAIMVNAAYTQGYGYDYRAAARITAVIHAYPFNPETAKSLLDRATTIRAENLELPQLSQVEQKLWDSITAIYNCLLAAKGETKEVQEVEPDHPTNDTQ